MKNLTLGSLFDGSGEFPLGAVLHGITPVWASEIEPFPIRVTTRRFPQMKHLGDIAGINGGVISPVDIISFGSPCVGMSVAGKREGLKNNQSVLFYEAIRVIREMREATNGEYPRFIIFENVQGAFHSNRGADFKEILDAIIGIAAPGAEVPRLTKAAGPMPTYSWETDGALLTGLLTLNISASPNGARGCTLSRILEASAPERFYLSVKACQGILRRAEARGKALPEILRAALEGQILSCKQKGLERQESDIGKPEFKH